MRLSSRKFAGIWGLCLVLVCMLVGCAGTKPTTGGAAPGEKMAEVVPDSLRAKFAVTMVDEDGKFHDFDAVLFSVPGQRYRMELTGPMGIGVASLLWTDEGWSVVFPTEKLYMKGRGYMVGLFGVASIPMVNIHQVAGFFEGKALPSGTKPVESRDSAGVKITDAVDPLGTQFSYAEKDGQVQWIVRQGRDGKPETFRFEEYREFEGCTLASRIELDRDGRKFLELRVKKVTHGKPFSLGTWRLKVPASYKPVGG